MDNTHDWVFHKNTYTKKWHAVKRENYAMLFSNISDPRVLKRSSIHTLEELINKTNGDVNKINKLLKLN